MQDRCTDADQAKSLARARLNESVPVESVDALLLDDTIVNAEVDVKQLFEAALNEDVIHVESSQRLGLLLKLKKVMLDFFVTSVTVNKAE